VNLVLCVNESVRTISRDTDFFRKRVPFVRILRISALCAFVSVVISASRYAIIMILHIRSFVVVRTIGECWLILSRRQGERERVRGSAMSQRSISGIGDTAVPRLPIIIFSSPSSSAINDTTLSSCNLAYNVSRDELTVLNILQSAKWSKEFDFESTQ
jgi:hypothetical protein